MKSLKSLMHAYTEDSNSRTQIDEKTICHLFTQLVMNEYGRYGVTAIQPISVKKNVLYVKINSSVWAQEIWTRRESLRSMLNQKIGTEEIQRIVAQT